MMLQFLFHDPNTDLLECLPAQTESKRHKKTSAFYLQVLQLWVERKCLTENGFWGPMSILIFLLIYKICDLVIYGLI